MNIFRSKFYQTLKRRLAVNTSQSSDDDLTNDVDNIDTLNLGDVQPISIERDHSINDITTTTSSTSTSSSSSSPDVRDEILTSLDSDQSDDEDNHNHPLAATAAGIATAAYTHAAHSMTDRTPIDEKDDAATYASLHADYISLTTSTVPRVYRIEWCVDEESVNFALLQSKKRNNSSAEDNSNNNGNSSSNKNQGILDVEVVRDELTFKLELCISGWKNSNHGYCAFYLTVPKPDKDKDNDHDHKDQEDAAGNGGNDAALMARYTVSMSDVQHSKQSSIRDDFYLGVGFPNFCTETLLLEAIRRSPHQQLWLDIKVEIFESGCQVQSIEHILLQKYTQLFSRQQLQQNAIASKLLRRMYAAAAGPDSTCCDVRIRCQAERVLHVHKCVLIASSMVFRKMFEVKAVGGDDVSAGGGCGFMESTEGEVNLERSLWRSGIVEAMVKFLYVAEIDAEIGGRIEDLFDLFSIAEYFEIDTLITECCRRFMQMLSPNNVCFLLLKFASHSCHYQHVRQVQFLQRHNILWRFVIKNIKQVQQTPYYQQIVIQQPMILSQLIDKMTSS